MWGHHKANTEGSEVTAARPEPTEWKPLRLVAASSDECDAQDRVSRLQQALDELRASYTAPMLSARHMIDPLLDVWGLAAAVDHSAAVPVETLLTALVHRSVVTPTELSSIAQEVEDALTLLVPRSPFGAPDRSPLSSWPVRR